MRCLLRFGLLFFLGFSIGAAEPVRIATYNLRNYLVMDRMVEGRWRPEYPKPEVEKTAIRQVILEAEPDILLLQEIGGPDFLEELRLDLSDAGLHYHYAVLMQGEDEVRHVALLSKTKPVEVVEHRDLDFKYFEQRLPVKRGLLEVGFELADGRILKVFGVHLKSRWSEESRDPESSMRRAREAQACRDRMIERTLDKDAPLYLVGGDFNDHPASAPLRRFYQKGDLELGQLLPIGDSRGHGWTHFYEKHGAYTQVDGFVLSSEVFGMVDGGRGHIVDLPDGLIGSDHRMVYFDLIQ
jgi:endonuclease/exonuclease/phosphatase family metal-dependent hydrolase